MSITREEAINRIKDHTRVHHIGEYPHIKLKEALDLALSALRPVSRAQVEKIFPGCDFCKKELDDYPYIVAHSDYSSSDTCYEPGYCPICGRPLTDEAVQTVMNRLEALYGKENS